MQHERVKIPAKIQSSQETSRQDKGKADVFETSAPQKNAGSNVRLAYRVNDACSALGVGRTSVYVLIANGELSPIKIAGRTLIPASQLHALIAKAQTD